MAKDLDWRQTLSVRNPMQIECDTPTPYPLLLLRHVLYFNDIGFGTMQSERDDTPTPSPRCEIAVNIRSIWLNHLLKSIPFAVLRSHLFNNQILLLPSTPSENLVPAFVASVNYSNRMSILTQQSRRANAESLVRRMKEFKIR